MRFRVASAVLWFFAAWSLANAFAIHAGLPRDATFVPGLVAAACAWLALGAAPVANRARGRNRRRETALA